jgi:Uncharacterized protein conserved in bacteria
MANDRIGADEGALKAGADAAVEAGSTIRRLSDDVEKAVEGTHGRWIGAGAEEFRSLMRQWDQKTESMIVTLDNLAEALGATERARAVQEDSVTSQVSRMRSEMSGI